MKAFITGSRAYGTPRQDSDTDLVIRADNSVLETLRACSDDTSGNPYALRFGTLNVVACTSNEQYEAWKTGTDQMIANAPVTREHAVGIIKDLLGQLCKPK